jgi:hypothetical protein
MRRLLSTCRFTGSFTSTPTGAAAAPPSSAAPRAALLAAKKGRASRCHRLDAPSLINYAGSAHTVSTRLLPCSHAVRADDALSLVSKDEARKWPAIGQNRVPARTCAALLARATHARALQPSCSGRLTTHGCFGGLRLRCPRRAMARSATCACRRAADVRMRRIRGRRSS